MRNATSAHEFHPAMIPGASLFFLIFAIMGTVSGQDPATGDNARSRQHETTTGQQSLAGKLGELQSKVAKLQAVLKQRQAGKMGSVMQSRRMSGMTTRGAGNSSTMGMKPMSGQGTPGMGGKRMGEKGMSGMAMMGQVKGMGQMQMPSALPGFAGASHIYHIGATGVFLDHPRHITLTQDQQIKLNQIKQQTLLGQATLDRRISQAEQELWVLTGSDVPDAAKIEAKIREVEKLSGDKRIAYIRAVGEAAGVLTDQQRQTLAGTMLPTQKPTTPETQN